MKLAKLLDSAYHHSPILFQNLAVSIKGWNLNVQRRSGQYGQLIQDVRERSGWTRQQHAEYQLLVLNRLVENARISVPHYRSSLGNENGSYPKLASLEGLKFLPILDRDHVKAHPESYRNRGIKAPITLHTTGTTGSPITIRCNRLARQRNFAFFDEYLESLGLDCYSRHAVIGGRIIVHPKQQKPPFWRKSLSQNSLLMSSYHLSPRNLDAYVTALRRFQPEYIEAYPSSAYVLASFMQQAGIKLPLRALITSSETLFPEQREAMEAAFNCRVFDQYGAVEMATFVGQCHEGSYHVRPDYGVLELLDENDNPVPPGTPGRVVCTGFVNEAMPLIRYPIGDMAIQAESDDCRCGLETMILQKILGRQDDVLVTARGARVGRMSPVLKGLPVQHAQYVQYEAGKVTLKFVPSPQFDKRLDPPRILSAIKLRLGDDTDIELQPMTSLDRGKGGKFRAVISHVTPR